MICITKQLTLNKLDILSTERMYISRGKVLERDAVGANGLGFQMVHGASEAIWGKLLCQGIGLDKDPIDIFGRGNQHPMQKDNVQHDGRTSGAGDGENRHHLDRFSGKDREMRMVLEKYSSVLM